MVSSTANPIAILATIMVNRSMVMGVAPMIPNINKMGARFGTMLSRPIRMRPMSNIIKTVMTTSAIM